MPRKSKSALLPIALKQLKSAGFETVYNPSSTFGRSVKRFKDSTGEFNALLQLRSHEDSHRYTVGVVISDLRHVDKFVAWFEDEFVAYVIPAGVLNPILDNCIATNRVAYSAGKYQWRVDFRSDENTLSPQLTDGERTYISKYRVEIPRPAPIG
jgi:hypothetical protein